MRASRVSNERGIALAVAVFALVVIGALVAGVFFAGRLEQQTGQNSMLAVQAGQIAEAGLNDAVAVQVTTTSLNALPIAPSGNGSALTNYDGPTGSHMTAARTVKRLSTNLFLLQAVGKRTDGGGNVIAQQTLAQLIRLNSANVPVNAGLTALGDVKISGGAQVSGIDAIPPAWTGNPPVSCPPTGDVTGIRYNNGTLTANGNGAVDGAPPSVKDLTLTPTQMQNNFNQLKALATLTVTSNNPPAMAPAYTGNPQKCDASVESNWGEPTVKTDACFDYFPIIYHYGDLKLQGGRGQGILLVEGDLTATGGMVFYGPVFVTGVLSTSGNSGQGAKFYGGVVAGNVALDDLTKLAGGALVNYSSCAIRRALSGSAQPAAFAERSWIQMYQ
jgi:hypothetical protein